MCCFPICIDNAHALCFVFDKTFQEFVQGHWDNKMTPETVDKSLTSLDWLRTLNPTALTQNIHSYHLATHSRNNSASIPSHNQYQQQQHHPNMYHNNRQPQHISVQNGSGPQNDQPTHYAVNGIVDSTSATAAALADDASIEETLELMKAQVAQQEGRPSFSYSTLIAGNLLL